MGRSVRLWRWFFEPVPTARFYFYGYWVLLLLVWVPLIVRWLV